MGGRPRKAVSGEIQVFAPCLQALLRRRVFATGGHARRQTPQTPRRGHRWKGCRSMADSTGRSKSDFVVAGIVTVVGILLAVLVFRSFSDDGGNKQLATQTSSTD